MISEQQFWLWVHWQNGEALDDLAYHYNTTRVEVLKTINRVSTRIDMIQGAVNREAEYPNRETARINHRYKMIKAFLAIRCIPLAVIKAISETVKYKIPKWKI